MSKSSLITTFTKLSQDVVDLELYAPKLKFESQLIKLLKTGRSILRDFPSLGDTVSLRQETNRYFSDSENRAHWSIRDEVGRILDPKESKQFYQHLLFSWYTGAGKIYFDHQRGLPLYVSVGNALVEDVRDPRMIAFYEAFESFDGSRRKDNLINIDSSWLDEIYFSQDERNLFSTIVSKENETGSPKWNIQANALKAYLEKSKGKLTQSKGAESGQKLSNAEKVNLLKTTGLLAVALAKTNSRRYTNASGVNVNAIKTDLVALLDDNAGLGERSIRDRLTNGIELIRSYIKEP